MIRTTISDILKTTRPWHRKSFAIGAYPSRALSSSVSENKENTTDQNAAELESTKQPEASLGPHKKTQAELDEEMRQKLEDFSGEGGAAGMEFENGKAVSMKRGVRDNMFRYI